jgi:predicted Zn-dependent protease
MMKRTHRLLNTLLLVSLPLLALGRAAPASAQGDTATEMRQTQEKMAELYEAKNDTAKSLAIWQELLKKHPNERKYMDAVCRLASDLGQHQVALPVAQRLVNLEPNNATYRTRLAEALLGAKREKEALPHLEWSLKKKPNDVALRENIAGIYETIKRPKLALAQYEWLIKRKPAPSTDKLLKYRITRMHLYSDTKQQSKALSELKSLRRDYPKNLEVRRELATHYVDTEDYDKARAELKAILAIKKGDPATLAQLAKLEQTLREAKRRAARERAEEERYQDWLLDLQQRAEDF